MNGVGELHSTTLEVTMDSFFSGVQLHFTIDHFVRIFARVDYFVDLLAVLFPRNSDFVHILFWRNPSVFIPVFSVN